MVVSCFAVLPDFACWANKYVQAHFDNDPTEEVEVLSRLPPRIKSKVSAAVGSQLFLVTRLLGPTSCWDPPVGSVCSCWQPVDISGQGPGHGSGAAVSASQDEG